MGGTRIFWGRQRGGASFFSVCQRGGPEFFEGHTGGGGTRIFSQNGDFKFEALLGGSSNLCRPRGGPEFYCACRGGDQNFFAHAKGGHQKKLATRDHKQTALPPVKMIAP